MTVSGRKERATGVMRRNGVSAPRVWALVLCGGLLASAGLGEEPRRVSEQALHRIQLECVRAYPIALVSEMTDGRTALPAELEKKPEKVWENLYPVTKAKGEFFPTVLQELVPIFTRHVTPGKRFLDLGSGDGRVVFLASLLGADAYGIEYEKQLVEASLKARSALSELVDPGRAHFVQGDFFESPWSEYDVIFYFNRSSFEPGRFYQKLTLETKPGAKVIVASPPDALEGFEIEDRGGGVSVFRKAGK